MKNQLLLPYYSIENDKLMYLNQYMICKLPIEDELREAILMKEGALIKKYTLNMNDEDLLVIEPHPDDFALSALGFSFGKYNAIVLNVFSRMNVDSFTWKDKIHITEEEYENLRLQESSQAIENLLGQKFFSLKEKSIRIAENTEECIINNIIGNVKMILYNNNKIRKIMVPMGVGRHPDHIIVYNALMKFLEDKQKYEIILYPEYPYSRCKKLYNDRIKEIGEKSILKTITVDVEKSLDIMADAISAYRSQYDDINREQMLAVIREDYKAIAREYNCTNMSTVYYKIERGDL